MPSLSARFLTRFLIPVTIFAACSISPAQEVIHALTGVATNIDSAAHTITLISSDGTQTAMQDETKPRKYDFDKVLQSSATESDMFNKQGDRVIVYYFGDGLERRAIAIKDLGPTPLKVSSGVVTKWDRHHRVVTIKTADGATQTFQLDNNTAVDTATGVVNGDKFGPQHGDQVSIKYLNKDGNNEAVYLTEAL